MVAGAIGKPGKAAWKLRMVAVPGIVAVSAAVLETEEVAAVSDLASPVPAPAAGVYPRQHLLRVFFLHTLRNPLRHSLKRGSSRQSTASLCSPEGYTRTGWTKWTKRVRVWVFRMQTRHTGQGTSLWPL